MILTKRYKSDQPLQIWPNVTNLTKRYKSDQTLQIWPIVTNLTKRYNCTDERDVMFTNQLITHISFCSCNQLF